jgi:hypothetical protein
MNLFFAYNRILVREQQLRIKLTGVMEPTFKIQTHPDFIAAGKAVQYAMAKSRYDGVHAEPKMFSDEQKILDHPNYQKNTAPGCQKRFAYYCLTVFLIRGTMVGSQKATKHLHHFLKTSPSNLFIHMIQMS